MGLPAPTESKQRIWSRIFTTRTTTLTTADRRPRHAAREASLALAAYSTSKEHKWAFLRGRYRASQRPLRLQAAAAALTFAMATSTSRREARVRANTSSRLLLLLTSLCNHNCTTATSKLARPRHGLQEAAMAARSSAHLPRRGGGGMNHHEWSAKPTK